MLLFLPFIAKELHINLAQVGIVGSVENFIEVCLALPAIYFAAKFGGLKTLTGALFLYIIGYIITGFADSYNQIIFVFIVAGVGFGLFHSIAFSLVANWSEKSHRGKQMGNFTALGDVGKTFFSAIAPFLVTLFGWRMTVFSYASIAIGIFLLLSIILSKRENETVSPVKGSKKSTSFKDLLTHKPFLLTNLTGFLDTMASGTLFLFLPFLLLQRGISPSILGVFTAIYFIGNVSGKVLLGKFADKYKNAHVFIVSEICMAIMILFLANASSSIIILCSSFLLGMFTKGTLPVLKTMVSESLEKHNLSAKGFGINTTVGSAANTIAPTIFGIVAYKFGIASTFEVSAGFAICAIIPAFILSRKN